MNIKNKLRFAIINFLDEFKTNILTITILMIALGMCGITLVYYYTPRYEKMIYDDLLLEGNRRTLNIMLDDEMGYETDFDRANQFENQLLNLHYVTGGGDFNIFEKADILDKIIKNQNAEYISVEKKTLEMMVDELKDGSFDINTREGEETVIYLYLGCEYSDIAVGTEYHVPIEDENRYVTFIVNGHFKKGQVIPNLTFADKNNAVEIDCVIPLDHQIVCVENTSSYGMYISYKEGYDSEIRNAIENYAKDNHLVVNVESFEDIFRNYEERNSRLVEITKNLSIFMFVITFILVNLIYIVNFMNRRKDYGILMANGYEMQDFYFSIILGNIIKIGLAALTTILAVSNFVRFQYTVQDKKVEVVNMFLSHYIEWNLILFTLLIFVLLSVIPIIILKCHTPVSFMRED